MGEGYDQDADEACQSGLEEEEGLVAGGGDGQRVVVMFGEGGGLGEQQYAGGDWLVLLSWACRQLGPRVPCFEFSPLCCPV